MARKVVFVSDLTGSEIPDDEQVEVRVLEYPDLSQPIKLDASTTEANRLKVESTPMALLELVSSDGTERIAISAEQFARAIKGDAAEVMANAEALTFPQQPESAPEPDQEGDPNDDNRG